MSEGENRPRFSPEKAAALTVAFTIAGSGIAAAQEQDTTQYTDTDQAKDAYAAIFKNGDTDGSGSLNKDEFKVVFPEFVSAFAQNLEESTTAENTSPDTEEVEATTSPTPEPEEETSNDLIQVSGTIENDKPDLATTIFEQTDVDDNDEIDTEEFEQNFPSAMEAQAENFQNPTGNSSLEQAEAEPTPPTFKDLIGLINDDKKLEAFHEENPDLSFDQVAKKYLIYLEENPKILKAINKEMSILGTPDQIINLIKKELEKKNVKKRSSNIAFMGLHSQLIALKKGNDPALTFIIEEYLGVTLPEFNNDYSQLAKSDLKEFKSTINNLPQDN